MLTRIKKTLRRMPHNQEFLLPGLLSVALFAVVASVYSYARLATLTDQVAQLTDELSSTTLRLTTNISEATTSLGNALQQETQHIQSQLGGVQDQVGVIGGAVTDLKKLSSTDRQLLAKYSKIFFLNENYTPLRLVEIPSPYKYDESKSVQLIPQVLPSLENMLSAARADGVPIYVDSGYRSFRTQAALKNQYTVVYGAGTANQFSADQGYSEHQLGTAVDLITTGTGGSLVGFDKKPAYEWLVANAYRYGYILSYPKDNTFYMFEPWHWRYVGVKLATDLRNLGIYFYQMDQRTIDSYLVSFFD